MPKLIDMARQSSVKIAMVLLYGEFYSAQVFLDLKLEKNVSYYIGQICIICKTSINIQTR